MATYTNATNPFIKPKNGQESAGCCNDTKDLSQKKNAPGMARMQSKKERKRAKKRAQENSLLQDTSSLEKNDDTEPSDGSEKVCLPTVTRNAQEELDVDGNDNLIKDCGDEVPSKELTDQIADQVADLNVDEVIDLTEPIVETAEEKLSDGNVCVSSTLPTDQEIANDDECASPTEVADDELGRVSGDSKKQQHMELIRKLRMQLRDLERYAYERGELEQVPPSVLAERQTVILDSLKRKLPLSIDEDRIEKLELEELKSQVEKEISDLIDPLITKDHLLSQLKTQLTDLERYISHLHKTLGKSIDKRGDCQCRIHGCSTPSHLTSSVTFESLNDETGHQSSTTIMNSETLPKTSRLIRGLMAQLICSDMKIQEAMKMEKDFSRYPGSAVPCQERRLSQGSNNSSQSAGLPATKPAQFHDTAVWNIHIDRVVLATDSLTNLFGIEPGLNGSETQLTERANLDQSLVSSVVRRQLVPALRDLLAYGLIDPNSMPRSTSSYFFFDPFYLISSLTCLPGSQSHNQQETSSHQLDKIHVWNVIEDYFNSRNEPQFKTSSVKTLSQSFNLTPSMDGPIKITSKQSLLIAVDDIIERLSRCKPNGPESHFKLFVYTALNQRKLTTWLRIIFRSKSTTRKFYHNFSFTSQPDKMEKFLHVIGALNQAEFKLNTDTSSSDQFVGIF